MAKKYIPNRAWLICDKGENPTQINVTHDNNSMIYGEKLVSEADIIPNENIQPFGQCALKGVCCYHPIYWDKCNQGVKVNGFKLVFEDANLLCKHGGKIKAIFNAPTNATADFFGLSAISVAMASQWLNYNDVIDYNQRGIIYDVENKKIIFNEGQSGNSYNTRSGNYAEMKDNVYHREQGYRNIRAEHPVIDVDKPPTKGIDAIYEKGGEYKITDGKYNTAQLKGQGNKRQLSREWTKKHLKGGAIRNEADAIAISKANDNGTLKREVIRTNTDGSIQREPVDSQGYRKNVGPKESLEMKKPSKASQFINKTRSSLRNSKPVQTLAHSKFSHQIRSKPIVQKANNELWKATQYVEATPWLKTTGKVVGRGAVVVGIALDGLSIYNAYEEEKGFGNKTQRATGSALGGAAGGWAGAEIGAVIGTAICPGVGTVIGGILGGVIGGIAGSGIGASIVDWVF